MSGVSSVFGVGGKRSRESFYNIYENKPENQCVLDRLSLMPYKEMAFLINKLSKNDFDSSSSK